MKENDSAKESPAAEKLQESIRNRFPEDKFPMTSAYIEYLLREVPGDAKQRTYGQLIAEATVCRAAKGDVRAAKELREATGGLFAEWYYDLFQQLSASLRRSKTSKADDMQDGSAGPS